MKKLIGVMALARAALFAGAAHVADDGAKAVDASTASTGSYGDGIHANDWLVRLRAISIIPQRRRAARSARWA